MKKPPLFLWVLLAILAFGSCSKSSVQKTAGEELEPIKITLSAEEGQRFVLLNTDYTVSQTDLLRQAQGLIRTLAEQETKTKGTAKMRRPVLADSMVTPLRLTKSDTGGEYLPEEIKVYVVSFGEDAGFAFVAGDKRGGGILGYADEGNFDFGEVNPGMQIALEGMAAYVESEIERFEGMRGDSIYNRMVERFGFDGIRPVGTKGDGFIGGDDDLDDPKNPPNIWDYRELLDVRYETVMDYQVGPLMASKWGQDFPYNFRLSSTLGYYKTGCDATAVAQIMNHHKYGQWQEGTTLHQFAWNTLANTYEGDFTQWPDTPESNVANLFEQLVKAPNLNTTLGLNESTSDSDNVNQTFTNFGYLTGGAIGGFAPVTIQNSLFYNRPVYMRGRAAGTAEATAGHSWVVDGITSYTQWEIHTYAFYYQGQFTRIGDLYYSSGVPTAYSVHCNWGYNGNSNCWVGGTAFSVNGKTYNQNMKIIPDIRPN